MHQTIAHQQGTTPHIQQNTIFHFSNMASTSASDNIDICPDNHQCENGSVCIENPQAEGKYYCDCDEGAADQVFSGLYCQHEATVYCTHNGEFSRTSFCTNEGSCKGQVESGSTKHLGCDCAPGYTGSYCQFIEGSEPVGFPYQNNPSYAIYSGNPEEGNDGLSIGVLGVVLIVAVTVSILGVIMAFVVRRRRLHASNHVVDSTKTTDGNLHDANGESLANIRAETFDTEVPAQSFDQDELQITKADSGQMA